MEVKSSRRQLLKSLALAAGVIAVTIALPVIEALRRSRKPSARLLSRLPRIVPLSADDIGPSGDLAG